MNQIINVKDILMENQAEELTRNIIASVGSFSLLTISQEINSIMCYFSGANMSTSEIAKRMADSDSISFHDLCVMAAYLKFHSRNIGRLGTAFETELHSRYKELPEMDETKSVLLEKAVATAKEFDIMDTLLDSVISNSPDEQISCSNH